MTEDPRATAPLLRVRDLGVTHAGATVTTPSGVSFEVHAGDVVLVLGPSGSGKSTLALTLNGLIPHALPADLDGSVEVGGIRTADTTVAALSTRVAMVFQDPDAQLVTGTVLDEVAFALENLRMPVAEILARAEAALRRVGLWQRRTWNPDRLSGGGRQRLAIACALAMGSDLLVLDEPTANLDAAGIDDVYDALGDVAADGTRAIVLVEHNLDAAIRFATRAVVLDHDGRLVFDGPVAEVLREHAAELVRMGVWLPTATLAALRLRRAGHTLDPLPLSPHDLRDALLAEQPTGIPVPTSPTARRPDAPRNPDAAGERDAAPAPPPLIRVRGLNITRHRARILHDIDLDIAAGSFTAVVGANGAGKTTLVQAIAGVVSPPRGSVRIGHLDLGRAATSDLIAQIGFVFQNPEHQFIAHTVFDELAHGLRLRRVAENEISTRVDAMLARFGLTAHAGTHPFLLSGGQKRRLSVGTALISGAPVLALDEPTFGQDRARADELLTLLRDLNAAGTTVLVVTHDLQLVTEYATHTVVMTDGRATPATPTADVFADEDLLARAGLRLPPLHRALRDVPGFRVAVRLSDLTDRPRVRT